MTVEVNQCNNVQVNRNVWNFLDTADFEDVGHLDLAEGAFIMKPTAIDTSRHGPVTKVSDHETETKQITLCLIYLLEHLL